MSYRASRALQGRRLPLPACIESLYFQMRINPLPSLEERELIEVADRVAQTKYYVTDIDELMKILETVDQRENAMINE